MQNQNSPVCKVCKQTVGDILYGRFGYYFKCAACANTTSVKFECLPGYKPWLRKDGTSFHRECAECGTSTLFHRNG